MLSAQNWWWVCDRGGWEHAPIKHCLGSGIWVTTNCMLSKIDILHTDYWVPILYTCVLNLPWSACSGWGMHVASVTAPVVLQYQCCITVGNQYILAASLSVLKSTYFVHKLILNLSMRSTSSNAAYIWCIACGLLFCRCEIVHIDVNVSRMNSRTCELWRPWHTVIWLLLQGCSTAVC